MTLDPALYCAHGVLRANCYDDNLAAAQAAGLVFPQRAPLVWPDTDDGSTTLPIPAGAAVPLRFLLPPRR